MFGSISPSICGIIPINHKPTLLDLYLDRYKGALQNDSQVLEEDIRISPLAIILFVVRLRMFDGQIMSNPPL